jgi:hypothetical protein
MLHHPLTHSNSAVTHYIECAGIRRLYCMRLYFKYDCVVSLLELQRAQFMVKYNSICCYQTKGSDLKAVINFNHTSF